MAISKQSGLNKQSLTTTGKNLLAAGMGVVMGASIPSKFSGLGGIATILAGLHFKQEWAVMMGTGLLFAIPVNLALHNKAAMTQTMSGTPDLKSELTQATTRAKIFMTEFGKKFYLDKVFDKMGKGAKPTPTDPGIGFEEGETGIGFLGSTPTQTLEDLNQSLIASAMDFQAEKSSQFPNDMQLVDPSTAFDLDELEASSLAVAPSGQLMGIDFERI